MTFLKIYIFMLKILQKYYNYTITDRLIKIKTNYYNRQQSKLYKKDPLYNYPYSMNLFNCCKEVQTGSGYQVTSKDNNKHSTVKFYKKSNDISKDLLASPNASILKINKSDYDVIHNQYGKNNKKWTDFSFPPNDQSLGVFNTKPITSNKWRRISQIVPDAVLFKNSIEPKDVVQSDFGDKTFLATLASLAQIPERIYDLFGNQNFNPNGYYKILIRVKSQIQQILIDDYVPVNQDGNPLFSKPNENQIWVMLLEKARAKVYGSYAHMIQSQHTPKQIFQQIDFAPTQRITIPALNEENELNKIWRIIFDNSHAKRPIVVKAGSKSQINWVILNLLSGHHYSLIDCVVLRNILGKQQRIIKLRNAYGNTQWKGTGHENDKVFWDQIQQSQAKHKFFEQKYNSKDGIFYMLYNDFIKYFTQVYINFYEQNGSYVVEDLCYNLKNGLVHEIQVYNQGFYTISIDQQLDNKDDGYSRLTLLVIRKYTQNFKYEYEFIDGTLKYDQPVALIKTHLVPGKYLIYSKIQPTLNKHYFPKYPHLVIFSQNNVKLILSSQQHHNQLLKKTFLSFGKQHKRQLYNDDLMWMSWKLFNQAGYGYIAFGNDRQSKQKFSIGFNQQDFLNKGFKLKKPFKNKGANQVLEVLPGQQNIILVRVINSSDKNLKFPPKISINIKAHVPASQNSLESLPSPLQQSKQKIQIN